MQATAEDEDCAVCGETAAEVCAAESATLCASDSAATTPSIASLDPHALAQLPQMSAVPAEPCKICYMQEDDFRALSAYFSLPASINAASAPVATSTQPTPLARAHTASLQGGSPPLKPYAAARMLGGGVAIPAEVMVRATLQHSACLCEGFMHLRNHAPVPQLCCYRQLRPRECGVFFIPAACRTRLTMARFSNLNDMQVPTARTPAPSLGDFHPPVQLCAPCTSAQQAPDSSKDALICACEAGGLVPDADTSAPHVAALAVSTEADDQVSGHSALRTHGLRHCVYFLHRQTT